MEFISETHPFRKQDYDLRLSSSPVCTISTRNVIAFSGCPGIAAPNSVTSSSDGASAVFVCELATPWNVHCVTGVESFVKHLVWDSTGSKLLVADASGTVSLWVMQDFTMNRWICSHATKRVCDDIVAIRWLHLGPVVSIASDVPGTLLQDKCNSERFAASLGTFGGRSAEGWVAVSGSGMVYFGWLQQGRTEMPVAREPLPSAPCRIASADMGFERDGSVTVLYTAGGRADCAVVHCARLQLVAQQGVCRPLLVDGVGSQQQQQPLPPPPPIVCQAVAGFAVRDAGHVRNDGEQMLTCPMVVQSVLYPCCYAARFAVVCLTASDTTSGSELQLWSLDVTPDPLLVSSSGSAAYGLASATVLSSQSLPASLASAFKQQWRPHAVKSLSAGVTSCTPSKMACVDVLLPSTGAAAGYSMLTLAFEDGTVGTFSLKSFSIIASAVPSASSGGHHNSSNCVSLSARSSVLRQQQQRWSANAGQAARIVALDASCTGSAVVALSASGTLYVGRVQWCSRSVASALDPALEHAALLVEYATYVGLDSQDVLLTMKPGMAELMVQLLTERIQCQDRVLHEVLKSRLIAVKVALLSSSVAYSSRAIDCLTQQLLLHVSAMFKAALRSRSDDMMDTSLTEKLSAVCSAADTVDNIMLSLEPRSDFVIDDSTCWQLKPMMQWLANLGLYLVKCIAMSKIDVVSGGSLAATNEYVGCTLARDVTTLQTLRELLVLVRIWSLVAPRCCPQITCATSIDPIAMLFQLLTKAMMECAGAQPSCSSLSLAASRSGYDSTRSAFMRLSSFSDTLVDECAHFDSQITLPCVERCLSWTVPAYSLLTDVSSSGSVCRRVTEFTTSSTGAPSGFDGERLQPALPFWQQLLTGQRLDAVQRLAVNGKEKCKQCSRCCLLTQAAKADKSKTTEIARPCLCGGLWIAV